MLVIVYLYIWILWWNNMMISYYIKKSEEVLRWACRKENRRCWAGPHGRYMVRAMCLLYGAPGCAVGLPPKTGAIFSFVTKDLDTWWVGKGLFADEQTLELVRGWPPREGAMGGLNQFSPVQGKKGDEPLAEGLHARTVHPPQCPREQPTKAYQLSMKTPAQVVTDVDHRLPRRKLSPVPVQWWIKTPPIASRWTPWWKPLFQWSEELSWLSIMVRSHRDRWLVN